MMRPGGESATARRRWGDKQRAGRAAALAVFRQIDRDRSGYLDRHELGRLVATLQPAADIGETELEATLATIDKDGSGEVDFEEFYGWWWAEREQLEAAASRSTIDGAESGDGSRSGGNGDGGCVLAASALITATQEQLLFLDRAIENLRQAGAHPNTAAVMERFRLTLIVRQQKAEAADLAQRAAAAAEAERAGQAQREAGEDAVFWAALMRQAESIWSSAVGVELEQMVERALFAGIMPEEGAQAMREAVTRGQRRPAEACEYLRRQWRAHCSTEAGSPKPQRGEYRWLRSLSSPTSSAAPSPSAGSPTPNSPIGGGGSPSRWYPSSAPKLPCLSPPAKKERRLRRLAAERAQMEANAAPNDDGRHEVPGHTNSMPALEQLDSRWCHIEHRTAPRDALVVAADARRLAAHAGRRTATG
eukprot:SAG11_NODE_1886_length_4117_cov_2.494027_1_plen_419_part_10